MHLIIARGLSFELEVGFRRAATSESEISKALECRIDHGALEADERNVHGPNQTIETRGAGKLGQNELLERQP